MEEQEDEREEGGGDSIAHPPEGEQEDSLESEETLSPDELGEERPPRDRAALA